MKSGLQPGMQTKLHVVVAPEMTVNLGGKKIHPFYSTYTAAHHAEVAARMILEPYLEPDEEGIGSGLSVHHHSPALVGQEIDIIVTVTRARNHHLATDFKIVHGERLIADGEVHQVILPREKVDELHRSAITSSPPSSPSQTDANSKT